MIRRSLRIGLRLGLLAGIGFALVKIFRPKPEPSPAPIPQPWPPLEPSVRTPTPTPAPTSTPASAPAPAYEKTLPPWVDPDDNVCPQSHPVKGKLSSMIFQVPGNFAYDRTKPDRCYQSAEAATNDGLRAAKR